MIYLNLFCWQILISSPIFLINSNKENAGCALSTMLHFKPGLHKNLLESASFQTCKSSGLKCTCKLLHSSNVQYIQHKPFISTF